MDRCYWAEKNDALVPGTVPNGMVPLRRFSTREMKTYYSAELLIEQLLGGVGFTAFEAVRYS
jgi:hypothetical protein